ncbi:MAG: O-antigen ligase family protein, partial [Microbacterium gubbeenense]
MARLTRHPVAQPPVAPEREATSHLAMRAYAAFVLFSGLAYSWWYNLLGAIGAAILIALVVAGSLAIWIPRVARRGFAWQRLPWAALGYVALAGASTAWSDWPGATVATWVVLVAFTLQGVIIADMLSWREIVRALEAALRWIIGGSIAIEVWVA